VITEIGRRINNHDASLATRQENGDNVGVTVTNTATTRASLSLPGSQHGLVGLRERADILHGTLEADPTAEGGYRVRLRIPLGADWPTGFFRLRWCETHFGTRTSPSSGSTAAPWASSPVPG